MLQTFLFSDYFQEILLPSTLVYTPGKRNKVDDDSVFCFDNQKVTSAASEVSAEIIHV